MKKRLKWLVITLIVLFAIFYSPKAYASPMPVSNNGAPETPYLNLQWVVVRA